ncbi:MULTISPECIES: tryptophan synthase subunit alpha [unclassified Curtobacterium]|uniref:tryptophan synthase subunit alpha n=1 Tax=unclassified Curtobacterium TaxID=257496 RepID=UPI000DA99476|nr:MULTISPECIES: tryptophan synthase subunit alpha [unclassified Curtobacterium]PZE28810.1 tryptophan synthase subunit alpha [Curtobacterium sp. MCBD17_028]PZE77161.1 tryptophan synthase subunit alpha [Curtobacterium sp. MCBD17_019]PZF59159.1 tryptophan synthase subunit alpha [Curtobacterium sp. MCBD17_034]PZF65189.1 tryptophan synthase subunit alpha [Curtobacterium sp. MCBD17_013]PZM34299.1 tryptophan synthase subunit alpha [Curtobacterium sp. MCBD17_031]
MSTTTSRSVRAAIDTANAERAGAVVGYLPAGFPDLPTSVAAAVALAENGVDAIELGLPYSDPVMDGPVIQRATETSLANGFRVAHVFDAVHAITERADVPVLVMTYWNPVLRYGVDRFADDLAAAGGSGLITPDLIPDEAGEWIAASERTGADRVFLAAPSSSDDRMRQAVEASRGFVYAVSTMGVTGARSGVDAAARSVVSRLRSAGVERTCVGLGISTAEQVSEILAYADGAIIGSAFVRALQDEGVRGVGRRAADLTRGATVISDDGPASPVV